MKKLRENKGARAMGKIRQSLRHRNGNSEAAEGGKIARIVGKSLGIIHQKSLGC